MKIALVHRRFTENGGTERYLVGFARFLVAAGHEVHVLCHEVRPDLRDEPGVVFVPLEMSRACRSLSLWRSVARQVAGYPLVMGFGRTPGHHLYRAGGGSHADYLRRVHPVRRWVDPSDWWDTALDRAAVRGARIVLANSRLGARGLERDYHPARVEVVYNGVDAARFRPDPEVRAEVRAELGVAGRLAVFVGNGFRRKGLDLALAALPAAWTLGVVGHDRPWRAPDNVRFLGGVRNPERLLQGADLMVLPTRYDPFANTCFEAMACGLPVLTSSANGVAELLPEPWLVADGVAALSAGFERLEDAAERTRVGERCREVALAHPREANYRRALELLVEAAAA